MIFHVLNRGNARDPIFLEDVDYEAFEKVMAQTSFRYRATTTCSRCCVMWNVTRCVQLWCRVPGTGVGIVSGVGCIRMRTENCRRCVGGRSLSQRTGSRASIGR